MRHLKKLLAEKYVENGVEPSVAAELAGQAIRTLIAAEAIPQTRAESWERDAQIYYLRGNNVPFATIQSSYNISRSWIYDAISRHGKRHRAASKAV
jgi:hypothetical protein